MPGLHSAGGSEQEQGRYNNMKYRLPVQLVHGPFKSARSQQCQVKFGKRKSYVSILSFLVGVSHLGPVVDVVHVPGCPISRLRMLRTD